MASWSGFDDLESGIAFYEYFFGPACITSSMYCGSSDCVADIANGGDCVNSLSCLALLNQTLMTAFRETRSE